MSSAAIVARSCVKCGSDDINVSWHGPGKEHKSRDYTQCRKWGRDEGPSAEHLCCCCRVCQYAWREDTVDNLS